MSSHQITLTINGEQVTRLVPARVSLADFLREELQLTDTHVGCEQGACGACTVRFNDEQVRGCLMFAVQADGASVDTVRGLTRDGSLQRLQDAFHRQNALQCGFCTPGMLIAAADLLRENPKPSREQVRAGLSGNYCRCTGYHAIVDAVMEAAEAPEEAPQ
jgi:aerobic-type carbon monoxide dehydrogenase small subunit (CoxS/CutS family)